MAIAYPTWFQGSWPLASKDEVTHDHFEDLRKFIACANIGGFGYHEKDTSFNWDYSTWYDTYDAAHTSDPAFNDFNAGTIVRYYDEMYILIVRGAEWSYANMRDNPPTDEGTGEPPVSHENAVLDSEHWQLFAMPKWYDWFAFDSARYDVYHHGDWDCILPAHRYLPAHTDPSHNPSPVEISKWHQNFVRRTNWNKNNDLRCNSDVKYYEGYHKTEVMMPGQEPQDSGAGSAQNYYNPHLSACAPVWINSATYNIGQLARYESKVYRCKVKYAGIGAGQTVPSADTTHWKEVTPLIMAHQDCIEAIVDNQGRYYVTNVEDDSDWKDEWTWFQQEHNSTVWQSSGTSYFVDMVVYNDGDYYVCLKDHYPGSEDPDGSESEPGIGSSWTDYWSTTIYQPDKIYMQPKFVNWDDSHFICNERSFEGILKNMGTECHDWYWCSNSFWGTYGDDLHPFRSLDWLNRYYTYAYEHYDTPPEENVLPSPCGCWRRFPKYTFGKPRKFAQENYTCKVTSNASTDYFTSADAALSNGTRVRFSGNTLPGGISADTDYYVRDASGLNFKVHTYGSTTAVDITSDVTCWCQALYEIEDWKIWDAGWGSPPGIPNHNQVCCTAAQLAAAGLGSDTYFATAPTAAVIKNAYDAKTAYQKANLQKRHSETAFKVENDTNGKFHLPLYELKPQMVQDMWRVLSRLQYVDVTLLNIASIQVNNFGWECQTDDWKTSRATALANMATKTNQDPNDWTSTTAYTTAKQVMAPMPSVCQGVSPIRFGGGSCCFRCEENHESGGSFVDDYQEKDDESGKLIRTGKWSWPQIPFLEEVSGLCTSPRLFGQHAGITGWTRVGYEMGIQYHWHNEAHHWANIGTCTEYIDFNVYKLLNVDSDVFSSYCASLAIKIHFNEKLFPVKTDGIYLRIRGRDHSIGPHTGWETWTENGSGHWEGKKNVIGIENIEVGPMSIGIGGFNLSRDVVGPDEEVTEINKYIQLTVPQADEHGITWFAMKLDGNWPGEYDIFNYSDEDYQIYFSLHPGPHAVRIMDVNADLEESNHYMVIERDWDKYDIELGVFDEPS